MKSRLKEAILFVVISLMVSAAVYRDAMWGGSLLAPLDLGPFAFENYRFMSDEPVDLPDNHFIIDQFTYDLPLQKRVYDSYRAGEIPWWDPYTYGGRPLLADAHINGTDPIRVSLYMTLPFELAYNWNYILRGILTGLGMFLLLRYASIHPSLALIFAIAYQFAGWFTLYFGHPWIQGAFLYYPFIWLAWMKALESTKSGPYSGLAALGCAMVFYAGNIQSHTYLPLFALSFLVACLLKKKESLLKAICITGASGIIGALMAAPVLINQAEFYLLSKRALVATSSLGTEVISGLLALPITIISTVFPWALGSFETIQPLRGFGAPGLEFNLFFSILTLLLLLASWLNRRDYNDRQGLLLTQSMTLISIYLIIICTPLSHIFYARISALAGMGITFMCAIGTQSLLQRPNVLKKWLMIVYLTTALAAVTVCTIFASFIYPSLLPKLEPKIMDAYASKTNIIDPENLSQLRLHQIHNFSNEISILQPEILISLLGLALFIYALLAGTTHRKAMLRIGLVISILPVVLHHERFRPKHPISMWERMEKGGPEQQAHMGESTRSVILDERCKAPHQTIFPNAIPALYQVHHVQGYSALQPASIYNTNPGDRPKLPHQLLFTGGYESSSATATRKSSRFLGADDGKEAMVTVTEESMNQFSIKVPPNLNGKRLLRIDTSYPGWECNTGPIKHVDPCYSEVVASSELMTYTYTPKGAFEGMCLSAFGTILIFAILKIRLIPNNGNAN